MPQDDIILDDENKAVTFKGHYLYKSPRVYEILKDTPENERLDKFASTVGYGIILDIDNYNKNYEVKSGDIVVDAGAHVGVFTRQYSDAVGPGGLVLAFEPDYRLFGIISHNMQDAKNVKIFPFGLWDSKEILPFHIPSKYWGSSSFTHWHEGTEWTPARVKTLDSVIEDLNIGKVNFIKMDVEGAEMRILKGAETTLRNVDALGIAAYHFQEGSLTKRTKPLVTKFLEERDFKIEIGHCSEGDYIVYANRR